MGTTNSILLLSSFPRSSVPVCKGRAVQVPRNEHTGNSHCTPAPLLRGFSQPATGRKEQSRSAGCWAGCPEWVLPGSVRNQRQKYQCLVSNTPRHKLVVTGSLCSQWGKQDGHVQSEKLLLHWVVTWPTMKTTATNPNICKERYYLLLLLWGFSKTMSCLWDSTWCQQSAK